MTHDFLIRGIDDNVHSLLSETALEHNISLNSIVKDALDKWIDDKDKTPRRHDMILFSDEKAIKSLQQRMKKGSGTSELYSFDFKPQYAGINESIQKSIGLEKKYNKQKDSGTKYCLYRFDFLRSLEIQDVLDLFSQHEQVYVLNDIDLYKLHLSKESIHKLLLN